MMEVEGEFQRLRTLPGRRVDAVKYCGRWLAATNDLPDLLGEGTTFESAIADLLGLLEPNDAARPMEKGVL